MSTIYLETTGILAKELSFKGRWIAELDLRLPAQLPQLEDTWKPVGWVTSFRSGVPGRQKELWSFGFVYLSSKLGASGLGWGWLLFFFFNIEIHKGWAGNLADQWPPYSCWLCNCRNFLNFFKIVICLVARENSKHERSKAFIVIFLVWGDVFAFWWPWGSPVWCLQSKRLKYEHHLSYNVAILPFTLRLLVLISI